MSASLRARVAVLLLAGTGLLAAAQVAVVVVAVLVLLRVLPTAAVLAVGLPLCIASVGALARGLRFLRAGTPTAVGVPVSRADAPALWSLCDELAVGVRARGVTAVTVVAEADLRIQERVRWLGLLGGRRELLLGLPVLQALDVAHLRALLAHEIAHDARADGRWTPTVRRGVAALDRAVARIRPGNLAGLPYRWWAGLVRRVAGPAVAAHEAAADRYAAAVAGPRAAAEAVRDMPLLAAAQELFLSEYVAPGWQAGHVPDDLFGGFLRVLAARAAELAPWAQTAVPDDRHRPLADRLATIAAAPPPAEPPSGAPGSDAPGSDALASDAPPAGALVPELPALGRALQALVYPPHGRTTAGWDDFFSAARTAEMQREADAALGALADAVAADEPAVPTAAGQPVAGVRPAEPSAWRAPSDAAAVLDLAAAGGLLPATRRIFPAADEREAAVRAAELVKLLLALAALRSGAARWRHSWTGTAELVTADGDMLDLGELAESAVRSDAADKVRRRLAEWGIDPSAAVRTASDATPAGAAVVGGLVNLRIDGARADLLILETGLFVVPGLPRGRAGVAKQRLAAIAAADDPTRAHAAAGGRFLPYADVTTAARVARVPRTWRLTRRDGAAMLVRAGLDSDELPGGWTALADAVAFLARARRV